MMKPQMQIKRIIHKTKIFFYKTLQTLKSSLSGGYQKLSHHQNPLYYSDNQNMQHLDQFYREFTQHWDSGSKHKPATRNKELPEAPTKKEEPCQFDQQSDLQPNHEETEVKRPESGVYVLAQRMKEMEIKEMEDGDHVLDIEEVLHYYSLIKSPAFIEIVDRFLMEMYSEFFLPLQQPSSVSFCSNSSRRLRPLSSSSVKRKMRYT